MSMKTLLKFFFLCFLLFTVSVFSQEDRATQKFKGLIFDGVSKDSLMGASVFNLNTVQGTLTDERGRFEVPVRANDTLMIAYLGYRTIKLRITKDLLSVDEVTISIYEKTEQMKAVTVKSHRLVGVLEIDVKQVPVDRYNRIHIRGLRQTYEVGKIATKSYTSLMAALTNPIDFVYQKFARKPRVKRKLKKIKEKDGLSKMLAEKYDRELIMEYLQLNEKQLEDLLKRCNFSDYFIQKASDLQVIDAILDCHENYRSVKDADIESNL